jgi:hypothetical protein
MGQTKTCKTSVCYSPSDDRWGAVQFVNGLLN